MVHQNGKYFFTCNILAPLEGAAFKNNKLEKDCYEILFDVNVSFYHLREKICPCACADKVLYSHLI